MNLRWTDIRNFIQIAPCSTLMEASRKLHISQPALSESLKRLEEDLGYKLFYRSRTGITMTPSGKVFLSKSQRALEAFEGLSDKASENRVFQGRVITIGCHPVVAQYTLPRALGILKQTAPDFQISLRHDLSRNIQMEIQRGNIDIGVVINPVEVPDLVIQKLAQDMVYVWSSSKKRADLDTIICDQNLFQSQFILRKWKNKPQKILHSDSLDLIVRLVNEGVGFGIIPERAVLIHPFSLKKCEDLPSYKDQISLVYRPEYGKVPAERLTLEALREGLRY